MQTFGIYVHIPFCKSRCSYCDFSSCTDFDLQEKYFEKLLNEISNCNYQGIVDSIYFGGGTPTAIENKYIPRVVNAIAKKFEITLDCEISLECNPDSFDFQKYTFLKSIRFNRFSLGVQSFDDKILQTICRRHDSKTALQRIGFLSENNENFSIDLILGLPQQTLLDTQKSFDIIKHYQIPHISAYGLKVENGTKLQQSGFVIDEDTSCDMYDFLLQNLAEIGVNRYEISNFAKQNFECRHNKKYWQRKNYLGFGASAHSLVDNLRFCNSQNIKDYLHDNKVQRELLTEKDMEWEYIFLNLRTKYGINLQEFTQKFNADFEKKYAYALNDCFEKKDKNIFVKPQFLYVLNSLLANF